jgi:hypothetical protein
MREEELGRSRKDIFFLALASLYKIALALRQCFLLGALILKPFGRALSEAKAKFTSPPKQDLSSLTSVCNT